MRRIHWLVVGLVLTAGLSVAALAPAKGIKISERSDDFTVTTPGEGQAECGGKRAVAGGFFGEFEPMSTLVIPLISIREDGSAWRLRAGAIGSAPGDATAYAYCAKKKKFPKLREGSEEETIGGGGGVESVTAECPGNRRAISGGFELPDQIILVTTSMRSGRGSWTVEFSSSGTAQAEALVYCAKGVKLKQRSSETTLSPGEQDTEKARCKRNQRVVSGGFDTESGDATFAATTASRRAGKRSWEATAFADGGAQPLTVYAYCLKQPKK